MSTRPSNLRASFAPRVSSSAGPSRSSVAGLPVSGVRYSRTARESLYPVPTGEHLDSLEDCVKATEGCVTALSSALDKLQSGIEDLPRLQKIFEIRPTYLLMPEPMLLGKKSDYAASLQPYIDKLLDRTSDLVGEETTRVERLEMELGLLEKARRSRLPAAPRLPGTFKDLDPEAGAEELGKSHLEDIDMRQPGITLAQRRKIGMLKNKREKLEKERQRLLS